MLVVPAQERSQLAINVSYGISTREIWQSQIRGTWQAGSSEMLLKPCAKRVSRRESCYIQFRPTFRLPPFPSLTTPLQSFHAAHYLLIIPLLTSDGVLRVTSSTSPALSGNGLVIHRAQVHAELGPRSEVVGGGHGSAAGALVGAHRDVLPKGAGGAGNGRLVDLLVLPNIVGGPVAGERADLLALGSALSVAVLLNVVLD